MALTADWVIGGPGGDAPRPVRDRLLPAMPGSRLWGWLGPLIVALFGAFLRFYRLGTPHAVVFDETFYAKDAFSTITYGVERQFVDSADALMLGGNTQIFKTCAQAAECGSFVAHPPLGKWMIGLGEWMFGLTPFGWRFMAALAGSVSILILARVARRLTRSTLLGCLAGFLLALDAMHVVLSRTALLDVFLTLWVIAAFACLVVDRDRSRERLVAWYEGSLIAAPSRLGLRPWRLAAGLCLGAALATKWTGAYFVAAFTIMTLLWDAGARRSIGQARPYRVSWRLDLPLGVVWTAVVPVVTWVASYAGWFATDKGWGRNWAEATSSGWPYFVFSSLRSWLSYQKQMLGYHANLSTAHPYQSEPWQWPLLLRPVAFYYETPAGGCGASSCTSAILGTGTPVIWFLAVPALVAMVGWWLTSRDWRAGAVLGAYLVGWLPWFYFALADNRTMYQFYALPMLPFMILAIVLASGLILGPAPGRRRLVGSSVVGAFALLVLVNFWWLSPVLDAQVIPYGEWFDRMLFRSWI
ncbi:phospholipid carrier-dependent glycosyltransferase [Planotetraspora thailandica]|uniref:Polyprenol-phosphate-mannose--protein mannosyltransferase n=1 Tax=Planotetraspora thailandica TaxID=487172 RepID=A0A8J3XTL6_9ACTN|nr:phospholipid carrier-dependent glycosyltransferase [Planotetraspora thailandica]GII52265.1 phospholipid carrier-dependent glycosyltransferase [Planotetraspora thailandica]